MNLLLYKSSTVKGSFLCNIRVCRSHTWVADDVNGDVCAISVSAIHGRGLEMSLWHLVLSKGSFWCNKLVCWRHTCGSRWCLWGCLCHWCQCSSWWGSGNAIITLGFVQGIILMQHVYGNVCVISVSAFNGRGLEIVNMTFGFVQGIILMQQTCV